MKNVIPLLILSPVLIFQSCSTETNSIQRGKHNHPVTRINELVDDHPYGSTTHVLGDDGKYYDAYCIKFVMEEVGRKIYYASYITNYYTLNDTIGLKKIAYTYDEKPDSIQIENDKIIGWHLLESNSKNSRRFGSIFNRKELRQHTIIIDGFKDLSISMFKHKEIEKIKLYLYETKDTFLHEGTIHFPDGD